jgi:hypothetical protein
MNLEERIKSFSDLGEILRNALKGNHYKYSEQIEELISRQYLLNAWFTPDNVRLSLQTIATELTLENLIKWTNSYPLLKKNMIPLKAGVIMAGNIPLVGFHDFLSVLISGNNIIAKTSSKDCELIVKISAILCDINPDFTNKIEFTNGPLTNFDVIIATGSNNSSRYFEYYFSKYPNIIRKNRTSIAIIDGNETDTELKALGTDIFSYFGLGCRNISKIFLPEGYELLKLIQNWETFASIINHEKYANNYDFNKAVYLVNKEIFHDTGYLLLKESNALSSPVSVLYYEYFKSQYTAEQQIKSLMNSIQCIVGSDHIPFGKAQSPKLWDYADGIDTIDFLLKKI